MNRLLAVLCTTSMKRLAIGLISLVFASTATAQPKLPPKPTKPVDPYAEPKPPPPPPKPKPGKPTDPYAEPPAPPVVQQQPVVPPAIPKRVDLADIAAVQGLLAVQRLDGWLLFDRNGTNPLAAKLVAPEGTPTRAWFYLVPAKGAPIVLCHEAEKRSFEKLAGTKLAYTGYQELEKQLRVVLKGLRTVAVEYSPRASVPNVSRVDAGTLELIRSTGVAVKSSDTLVQYTKAIWGEAGRTAHYVAAHHLVELRKDATAFIASKLRAGLAVTEYEVQQRIVRAMQVRGLVGPPPVIAAGFNTGDPFYVPTAARTSQIGKGDPVILSLAAKVDRPDGVYAALTWVALADSAPRDDLQRAFALVGAARDQALAMLADRARKNRPITGAEIDRELRTFFKKGGVAEKVKHRTGHSLDGELQGSGADLDDFEVKDTRILTAGTGFTIGPGIYTQGAFGVRTEISVYMSPTGPELTTPIQTDVELLLK